MRLVISALLILLTFSAQTMLAQEIDSLAFVRSRKMSDADLAKKREGTFFTAIPDFSADPVTGFGLGVRGNIFWNGERTDPFFAYTPYFAKLKANAAYYTSNARELILSLDIPYYNGTPWRFKVDFKAQQNPANLYFGLTEKTLDPLRLPSTPTGGQTYTTYQEYDHARKTIRPGEPGEAALVTDALSNRFRETEFMLNLKADYSLGKSGFRVMAGYEIQNLSYATFEDLEAEAINPTTGQSTTAPNGLSLLKRDSQQRSIVGYNGGWLSIFQTALIYDTRDFEPDPSEGYYFEIANEFSNPIIGSQFAFNKLFLQARTYQKLPIGPRTVFAGRFGIGNIFGENAPFFEFQDQWSPDGSINSLGGRQSLRGYRANRFLTRSLWFFNAELRVLLAEIKIGGQQFGFGLVPFFDAGTVRDRWQELNFTNVQTSFGIGARIIWNQSTVVSFDYGISREDNLFFIGLGHTF
jgi:outer membrane protein assembly factor BamA